jgi:hypothetical protein
MNTVKKLTLCRLRTPKFGVLVRMLVVRTVHIGSVVTARHKPGNKIFYIYMH